MLMLLAVAVLCLQHCLLYAVCSTVRTVFKTPVQEPLQHLVVFTVPSCSCSVKHNLRCLACWSPLGRACTAVHVPPPKKAPSTVHAAVLLLAQYLLLHSKCGHQEHLLVFQFTCLLQSLWGTYCTSQSGP